MAKLLKKDEPIQVQFGAAQAAEPPVVNLANRGKYGADYFGKKQADGEGLWHAYAEQIRKTNEERQRAWDEFNAAEVAAAKKKNDHHAHRMALQVSGFGRYKTAQAQRIADARLKKQRLDMQQDSSSPATTAAAAPGGRGGGRDNDLCPHHQLETVLSGGVPRYKGGETRGGMRGGWYGRCSAGSLTSMPTLIAMLGNGIGTNSTHALPGEWLREVQDSSSAANSRCAT